MTKKQSGKQRISFKATKIVSKPTKVEFFTQKGERVNFSAKKDYPKVVKVNFSAKKGGRKQ